MQSLSISVAFLDKTFNNKGNLKQNEKDIVNKKLSEELYQRQRNIETRLIKATDALKEQDKNDEREAESVSEYKTSEPPTYIEYIKKKENTTKNSRRMI